MKQLCLVLAMLMILTACAPANDIVDAPDDSSEMPDMSVTAPSSQPETEPDASPVSDESQPVSTTPTSSVSAVPIKSDFFVETKDSWFELYCFKPDQIMYTHIATNFPDIEPSPVVTAINALPPLEKGAGTADAKPEYSLMFVYSNDNYKKVTYELFATPSALKIGDDVYPLTREQYDSLKKVILQVEKEGGNTYPAWIVFMNPNRVVGIQCTDKNGRSYATNADSVPLVASAATHYLSVSGGKTYNTGSKKIAQMTGVYKAVYTFDSGVKYTIVIDGSTLYLESSDMPYGCEYTHTDHSGNYVQALIDGESGRVNPPTAKPVIYLYPTRPTDVKVNLRFDGQLTYTYPALGSGWSVTAYPDGRLVNKADGSEHYYLFWEGNAPHRWDMSTGFVVKGADTEAFLREKLAYMGLTPREYNDFITWWVPKMQHNPYNLIHFSETAEYGQVARLTVDPAPDSLLRIHMAWQPLQAPVDVPTQTLVPFVRQGFTVVEWGGTQVDG